MSTRSAQLPDEIDVPKLQYKPDDNGNYSYNVGSIVRIPDACMMPRSEIHPWLTARAVNISSYYGKKNERQLDPEKLKTKSRRGHRCRA